MKIALIADTHLSDVEKTPQEQAFNWALGELEKIKPDACIWLGDITACGSFDAAIRFRQKTDSLTFPSITVAGNSDIRTADTAPIMERFLSNYPKGLMLGGIQIIGANTSHDCISPDEMERLSALEIKNDVLFCAHQSPKHLKEESLEFLKNWMDSIKEAGYRVIAWVHGHVHKYREGVFNDIPTFSIRAVDLDKNIDGDAHICLMNLSENGDFVIEQIPYTHSDPRLWSSEDKKEFADYLGITCYNRSKIERDMPFAIANKVRHLEWRSINEGEISLIEKWRSVGGESFSLHFPSPGYDSERGIIGIEKIKKYSEDAVCAGADIITVHPPYVVNELLLAKTNFDDVADATAEALLPVAEAGIEILVENNHTKLGTPWGSLKREYGCTPIEQLAWKNALAERLGKEHLHLRFDVGHARNNMPLSMEYPIGKWYSLLGQDVRSYHLHQTLFDKADKTMHNHHPITGLHDGLISFDGFLWAWHSGVLTHGPLILEIREGEGACETWSRLQNLFLSE